MLYIAGLKIAQLHSAASSPTGLPAPLVNDAGVESDPMVIVMLLDELLLDSRTRYKLRVARKDPNNFRFDHVQPVEDGCCCQYIRCVEIEGEGSSCAVADDYRSCSIIAGVRADTVCGTC